MIQKLKKNFVITFWIFFILSVLFFLTESLYNQKRIDDYLIEFQDQNKNIEEKNILQKENLDFFESKFYKEIYAKENLNLLNKWEDIVIIEKNFLEKENFLQKFLSDNLEDEKILTNSQKWEKYFNLN